MSIFDKKSKLETVHARLDELCALKASLIAKRESLEDRILETQEELIEVTNLLRPLEDRPAPRTRD